MAMPLSPSQPPGVHSDSRAQSLIIPTCFPVCLLNLLRWRICLPGYLHYCAMYACACTGANVCVCALRECVLVYSRTFAFPFLLPLCVCRSKDANVKNGQRWEKKSIA